MAPKMSLLGALRIRRRRPLLLGFILAVCFFAWLQIAARAPATEQSKLQSRSRQSTEQTPLILKTDDAPSEVQVPPAAGSVKTLEPASEKKTDVEAKTGPNPTGREPHAESKATEEGQKLETTDSAAIGTADPSMKEGVETYGFVPGLLPFWDKFAKVLTGAKPPVQIPGGDLLPYFMNFDTVNRETFSYRQDYIDLAPGDVALNRAAHARFLQQAREMANQLPYKKGSRGIVTTASGRFFPPLMVTLRMLRRTGCTLPVEVMIESHEAYEDDVCQNVLPSLGAKCLVLEDILQGVPTKLSVYGYQLKGLLPVFSSFDDMLLLDADCIAVVNPEELMDAEPYTGTGMVIWPDFWTNSASPKFYEIAGIPAPHVGRWAASESGELLISKSRHLETLLMVAYYNLYGPGHYYRMLSQGAYGEGDKETFLAAAQATNKSAHIMETFASMLGYFNVHWNEYKNGTLEFLENLQAARDGATNSLFLIEDNDMEKRFQKANATASVRVPSTERSKRPKDEKHSRVKGRKKMTSTQIGKALRAKSARMRKKSSKIRDITDDRNVSTRTAPTNGFTRAVFLQFDPRDDINATKREVSGYNAALHSSANSPGRNPNAIRPAFLHASPLKLDAPLVVATWHNQIQGRMWASRQRNLELFRRDIEMEVWEEIKWTACKIGLRLKEWSQSTKTREEQEKKDAEKAEAEKAEKEKAEAPATRDNRTRSDPPKLVEQEPSSKEWDNEPLKDLDQFLDAAEPVSQRRKRDTIPEDSSNFEKRAQRRQKRDNILDNSADPPPGEVSTCRDVAQIIETLRAKDAEIARDSTDLNVLED